MENIIESIVQLEWEAFQTVQGSDGRASCQDDLETFTIMRKSQFLAWDEASCASYLHDLQIAKQQGRNLVMEKYARMMANTAPQEYRQLENSLPPLPAEVIALADSIALTQVAWQKEYARRFPRLAGRARSVTGDRFGLTGFETYLHGELLTYSLETLRLLAAHIDKLRRHGLNMSLQLMEHTVRMYGYASLAEAEANV